MSISDVVNEKISLNVMFERCSVLIRMLRNNAFAVAFTVLDVMLIKRSVINCSEVKNETSSALPKHFDKYPFSISPITL